MVGDTELDDFLDEMMSQWQTGDDQQRCDSLFYKMSLAEEALVKQYGEEMRNDLRNMLSLQLEYCRLCVRRAYLAGCSQNKNQGGIKNREKNTSVWSRANRVVVLNRVRSESGN